MPNNYRVATSYIQAKEAGTTIINPNDVMVSNQGYIKINGIEIAELSEAKIWFEVETSKVNRIGTRQRGEIITDVQGKLTVTIHKIYSRFKSEIINAYRKGQPFYFNLELTTFGRVRDANGGKTEEDINIGYCWFNKDITIAELNSEGNFLNEVYEGGFVIDSLSINPISDGEQWGE
nr:MAG TPA: tail tube protein [Caudoviricetes sp.]